MGTTSTRTSYSIHQQVAPHVNNDDSQCDTIYDEEDKEMTEGEGDEGDEEDLEEEDEEKDKDEDENRTEEGSSTCTEESSDGGNEQVPLSNLSPEIQLFANQFPDFCKQFQVLSKIGEGFLSSNFYSYWYRYF